MSRGKFSWPRKGYKYQMDESYKHETYQGKDADKIWYQQIPCKCGGFIGLYSLDPAILKFWSPSQRKTARAVYEDFKETGATFDDKFDGWEVELFFPSHLLPIIAERVGARRRRQLSPEDREKAIARIEKFQFTQKK